jgi:hypothetical protein
VVTNYEGPWEPLLKASRHAPRQVAAVFIWATSPASGRDPRREQGEARLREAAAILGRFAEVLRESGVGIHVGAAVTAVSAVGAARTRPGVRRNMVEARRGVQ